MTIGAEVQCAVQRLYLTAAALAAPHLLNFLSEIMMDRVITFGQFHGRTFAWLFFNAPWYADWLHRKAVLESRYEYDEEDCSCFRELRRRDGAIAGVCRCCNERKVVRMAFSRHSGGIGMSAFCCGECRPINEGRVDYQNSTLLLPHGIWTHQSQLAIARMVKAEYIGSGNLTQRKMEEFFSKDDFFHRGTPNFFTGNGVVV